MRPILSVLFLACALAPLRGQSAVLGKPEWKWHEPFPGLQDVAYAVDPVRQRLVRYGGSIAYGGDRSNTISSETWEWDGTVWRKMSPLHSPPPLKDAGMAYDPVRKAVLLFGGINLMSPKNLSYLNQTWEWDGQDWRQLQPKNAPSPRFGCENGLVTDFKRNRVVLYGGYVPGGLFPLPLNETWEWDGQDWKDISTSVMPGSTANGGARGGFFMGYAPKTGKIYLYGGLGLWGPELGDTWELDGATWKEIKIDPKDTPGSRTGFSAAADPVTGELLLFGGYYWSSQVSDGIYLDDLWAFDGQKWTLRRGSTSLSNMFFGSFYELGGKLYTVTRGTWFYHHLWTMRFNGKTWDQVHAWPTEPDSTTFNLVYDQSNQQTLLIGSPKPSAQSPDPIEVYRYVDERFEKIQTKVQPAYGGSGLVHHPGIGKTIYFDSGGYSGTRKAWLFDGKDWAKGIGSSTDPIPSSAVYYPERNSVIATTARYQTWEWDDKLGWSMLVEHKSGPRSLQIAYDTRRKKLVGYGPKDGDAYTYHRYDTWEWDGNAWTLIPTKTRPQALSGGYLDEYELAYMPELGGVVLVIEVFDPYPADPRTETWLYDGTDWRKLAVADQAAGKNLGINSLMYDPGRQRLLLQYNVSISGMIRELTVPTLAASQPIPRPGEMLSFDTQLPQAANQPFVLCLSQGRSPGIPLRQDQGIGTRLLPLTPDAVFLWSLSGPIVTVLDAQGKGSIPFLIPKDPGLSGLDLWAAGFTLTPSFGIGAITNAAPLQITN